MFALRKVSDSEHFDGHFYQAVITAVFGNVLILVVAVFIINEKQEHFEVFTGRQFLAITSR